MRWCIPLRSATNIIQSWGSSIQEAGPLFRVPITLGTARNEISCDPKPIRDTIPRGNLNNNGRSILRRRLPGRGAHHHLRRVGGRCFSPRPRRDRRRRILGIGHDRHPPYANGRRIAPYALSPASPRVSTTSIVGGVWVCSWPFSLYIKYQLTYFLPDWTSPPLAHYISLSSSCLTSCPYLPIVLEIYISLSAPDNATLTYRTTRPNGNATKTENAANAARSINTRYRRVANTPP